MIDIEPVWVWGVPFARFTMAQAVSAVDRPWRSPVFITAPVHYAMLTDENADLAAINERAAFIITGVPWYGRLAGGAPSGACRGFRSDLRVERLAAQRGYRLFLLGGTTMSLWKPDDGFRSGIPDCRCTRHRAASVSRTDASGGGSELLEHVAAGLASSSRSVCQKHWIARHLDLAVPVVVQVGGFPRFCRQPHSPHSTLDAEEWPGMGVSAQGLEPRRLFGRYARNAWFVIRMVTRNLGPGGRRRYAHSFVASVTRGSTPVPADVHKLSRKPRSIPGGIAPPQQSTGEATAPPPPMLDLTETGRGFNPRRPFCSASPRRWKMAYRYSWRKSGRWGPRSDLSNIAACRWDRCPTGSRSRETPPGHLSKAVCITVRSSSLRSMKRVRPCRSEASSRCHARR